MRPARLLDGLAGFFRALELRPDRERGLQPSQIHAWVNQVLAQAERAFDLPSAKQRLEEAMLRKIAHLEAKLANKNEVIAEPDAGARRAKKKLGEL